MKDISFGLKNISSNKMPNALCSMFKRSIFLIVLVGFGSCGKNTTSSKFLLGTTNDTAIYYYDLGWKQIMDNGEWTKAEASFRKASAADPSFILGTCLKGRISRNLKERKAILQKIEAEEKSANPEQQLLIAIYKSSISLMNQRDMGITITDSVRTQHYNLSEKNMRLFLKKYPTQDYVKAEYIEILHARYGPQQALDSINQIASDRQRNLPFYLGYAASLQAQLSNFKDANLLLARQKEVLPDSLKPQYFVSSAEVFLAMDSIKLAKKQIDRAVELDSNHLIARGFQKKIMTQLIP